ncbi:probable serine hydrolase isoform X2 [Drosophila albomicans]|uniref:Probable serine hydrolase isoform X2 n=1 Tax=Drosophila albomicans TaxID=7291 RepID=A0A6P8WXT0_DROAB|nr:probable serine hydrolase isoform X2 [Drosophila albomicans]
MGTLSLSDYEDVRIWAPWGHISGRWYGNRTERPILAIHGWLDNLGTFDTLIPLLPDYLGVLCIDLPGHGCSSRLPPGMHYSMHDYVFIIARVMKAYKWQKVSLLGHSLGGVLGFLFTALAPHTVDMIISLDICLPILESPRMLSGWAPYLEKHLVEEERAEQSEMHEPPSYTLPQLRSLMAKGSFESVPKEFAHHLLYRSVAKSQLYPEKYYFSRDGRVKYYVIFPLNRSQGSELARRVKKPFLIIKASNSPYVSPNSDEAIAILRKENPHFEMHEVAGSHHAHLTNATEVAKYLVPFIRHHRPPPVSSWSLAGEEANISKKEKRKAQERFFSWNLKRRSKL